MRRLCPLSLVVGLVLVPGLAACGGDDDGGSVREIDATGDADAAASGAASGSASGLSASDVAGTGAGTDAPAVQAAVQEYSIYVEGQVAEMITATAAFTDAVRAGDLEAAQAAYAPSRQAWERIEPIAGLIEDIDVAVDARVDDFESPEDPAWTGWHRLEYLLWEQGTTAGAAPFADQLDADLARLQAQLPDLDITPLAMAKGAGELIEEVSTGKIQGEEDRYSRTDLWDLAANVAGARQVVTLLTPALEAADPDLLATLDEQFGEVETGLEPYRDGDGWKPYTELTDADKDTLQADLAALSESLATVPGTLELE